MEEPAYRNQSTDNISEESDGSESNSDDIIYKTDYFYVTRRPNVFEVQLTVDPVELNLQQLLDLF